MPARCVGCVGCVDQCVEGVGLIFPLPAFEEGIVITAFFVSYFSLLLALVSSDSSMAPACPRPMSPPSSPFPTPTRRWNDSGLAWGGMDSVAAGTLH